MPRRSPSTRWRAAGRHRSHPRDAAAGATPPPRARACPLRSRRAISTAGRAALGRRRDFRGEVVIPRPLAAVPGLLVAGLLLIGASATAARADSDRDSALVWY